MKFKGLNVPPGFILDNDFFKKDNKNEILKYINENKKYAVRSSAIDEDGSVFSFAGLQDTYLNVTKENILKKIDDCYLSQFSDRATRYREEFNIGPSTGMTVVIQEMVNADFSGVIFTQNPINNRVDEIVIEVTKGLGEKLVSGLVTPTHYVIDKSSTSIKSFINKGSEISVELINELTENVEKIEKIYGLSQDIEFAICNNEVYILQARPITTVTKVPKKTREGLRFLVSFGHIQNMLYPITPIGAEMIQQMLEFKNVELGKNRIVYNGEFLFLDITEIALLPQPIHKIVSRFLKNINHQLPQLMNEFRTINKTRKMPPKQLRKLFLYVAKSVLKIMRQDYVNPANITKQLEDNLKENQKITDPTILLENQNTILAKISKLVFPYIFTGMIGFFKTKKLFKKYNLDMTVFNTLLSGLDGNVTTEMGLLYDDVLINFDTEKGHFMLDKFIEKYGMRVDGEIDLGRERPYENIKKFKSKVKKEALRHTGESLRIKHHKMKIDTEKSLVQIYKSLSKKKAKKLKKWIDITQGYMILREHPKYYVIRHFALYKNLSKSPFLTLREQFSDEYNKTLIEKREQVYNEAFNKKIPLVMLSNGAILHVKNENQDGDIIGQGVSSGIIEAKVRVIENIEDDYIRDGEILVTHFTDPGWTPYMAKSSGLIIEVGGMMTHGAIVAREYGIPAIVGLDDATRLFKTGQRVLINGDTGEITIL